MSTVQLYSTKNSFEKRVEYTGRTPPDPPLEVLLVGGIALLGETDAHAADLLRACKHSPASISGDGNCFFHSLSFACLRHLISLVLPAGEGKGSHLHTPKSCGAKMMVSPPQVLECRDNHPHRSHGVGAYGRGWDDGGVNGV